MKIAIIGSGAMGSLFGGLLAENGQKVTLVDKRKKLVQKINENGLKITNLKNKKRTIEVKATTSVKNITKPDLAIIFVKSSDTEKAVKDSIQILKPDVNILTLQNGLGNPETIAKHTPEEKIIAGTTTHGSTEKNPGHIKHAGEGDTVIGRYFTDNDGFVNDLASTLTDAGIDTNVSNNIQKFVWEKVLVNIGINPLTALARVKNGALLEFKAGTNILERAIEEGIKVAKAEGVNIRKDIISHAKNIAEKTRDNKSSMLQDIEQGRKTEIEYLSGAIVKRAEKHNISVPTNETLNNLILLAEEK